MRARRLEPWLIGGVALLLTAVPAAVGTWPHTVHEALGQAGAIAAALGLVFWRQHPVLVTVGGGGVFVAAASLATDLPNLALLTCTALAFVAGERFGGRSAWTSAAAVLAWLALMYLITGERDAGLVMFTVPGFVGGTVVRLRRETADELVLRGQELEAERELFARLAVRNERARIAAELHDIIGHSLSVMVVQAAAGQRLLRRDSPDAREAGTRTLAVVAESARQGRDDLARLVDLLGGQEVPRPDLQLVDEIVSLAAESGLRVAFRFDGDRERIDASAAAVALRVVRESLTNALRHAPGAGVEVALTSSPAALGVRVENDAPTARSDGIIGTGQGLRGLRDLVEDAGGRLDAGATATGGWLVDAVLPG